MEHGTGLTVDDAPLLFGVAGAPAVVARSLSPAMFAAAFASAGITAYYVPLGIRECAARKALRSLARLGFRGANVTMPFKSLAAEIADVRSPAVEECGVANVLTIDPAGHLAADATDGAAVIEALQDRSVELGGATVTLVGAGGSATEIAFALAHAGVARLNIVNRSRRAATVLARRLQGVQPGMGLEVLGKLPIHDQAHVLVSAVPIDVVDTAWVRSRCAGMAVVDLAYRPDRQPTPLIEAATGQAAACIDGREVLARQGAAAYGIWMGTDLPFEVMVRAVT